MRVQRSLLTLASFIMKGDSLILDFGVHFKEPISLHMPADVRNYVTQVLTKLFEYLLHCKRGIPSSPLLFGLSFIPLSPTHVQER